MSNTLPELTRQIRTTFENARAARAKGDVQAAVKGWTDIIARTEGATEREYLQARMASCSECAVAFQELGDARQARNLLLEAIRIAEQIVKEAEGASEEERMTHWMALAGVRTNLAALYVASREAQDGADTATSALEALSNAAAHPAQGMLDFAARMQRGSAYLLLGRNKEGVDDLRKATETGLTMVEKGQQQVLPQLVESVGRLFSGAKTLGEAEENFPVVEKVARIVTAAFEANGQPYLNLFVAAQMHRVNALLDLHRFADAEDELWHMIDGSGQGNVLMSAPDFYVALWRRDDETLSKGGLPRDEIVEEWSKAIDLVEQRDADPIAVAVLRQRFALHTQGAKDETRRFLEEKAAQRDTLSPVAVALLNALQAELNAA